MNEIKKEDFFSTRDLPLAATLVTLKFFMSGVNIQLEGNKNAPIGYFCFKNSPALEEARQKYGQGLLAVEPKILLTNLRNLKAEVVNAINQM
jgi:hypothetical protein